MSLLYADTSALVRAYFADEPDHELLRGLLLEGSEPVVTSELARVEFASAVAAAARTGRLSDVSTVLDRFDADCGDDGPLTLLRLDRELVFDTTYELVGDYRLRTLDAIHLAVALTDAADLAAGEKLTVVTRDEDQATAAREAGLATV
jgi:predicted nucleic acid-binding protein